MASQDRLTLEETLATFDEHLRRTRGLGAGTRRNYARFVRRFLVAVFDDGPVEVGEIAARGRRRVRRRADATVAAADRGGRCDGAAVVLPIPARSRAA